jgi:two-component system response regulator FixJ
MCHGIDNPTRPTVYIVENDPQILQRLQILCGKIDACVVSCSSAENLLQRPALVLTQTCLITKLELPGISGLELLEALKARGASIPAIILAGNSDIPTAVRAMRAGAVEFFDHPFSDRILLKCIRQMFSEAAGNQ